MPLGRLGVSRKAAVTWAHAWNRSFDRLIKAEVEVVKSGLCKEFPQMQVGIPTEDCN